MEDALEKGRAVCRAFCESRYADLETGACFAGTALWNAEEPLDEIIRRAREAVYAAKTGGKDKCLSWKGMRI